MSDTIIEIVHQEGKQLIAIRRQHTRVVLDGTSEAQLGWPWRRWERLGALGNWTGGVRFANSPSASYRKGVEGRVSHVTGAPTGECQEKFRPRWQSHAAWVD